MGFLALPKDKGGYGVPYGSSQTLAWLACHGAVNAYLEFLRGRSGGIVHGGHATFAALAASVVKRGDGYLTQQPTFAQTLPPGTLTSEWATECQKTWELAQDWLNEPREKSRRPEEPIQSLLNMADPLAPIFRAIKALDSEAAAAPPNSIQEAVLKRDALLLSIVVANPLRARNLVLLTFRPNNTGALYRREDGQWRIRFGSQDFKNDRKS